MFLLVFCLLFFFFKQKTAYEMRISDWSSDVCSSDLDTDITALGAQVDDAHLFDGLDEGIGTAVHDRHFAGIHLDDDIVDAECVKGDRKSVVEGKSVSVRVDLGGRRIIKKTRY